MYLGPISIKRHLIHWKLLALVKYYMYLQHLLNGSKCFHRLTKILLFHALLLFSWIKFSWKFNSAVVDSKVILLRPAWHKTSSNGFTECYNSAERMQYFSNLNNLTLRETQALMSYSAYIMRTLFYLLEKGLVPFLRIFLVSPFIIF